MIRQLACMVLVVALVACTREPTDAPNTNPSAATATPHATTVDRPRTPAQPVSAPPMKASGPARTDGYGRLRFGMTADEVRQAWGSALDGKPGPGETCHYLTPRGTSPRELRFMIESGKFARYDVGRDAEVAPGGGRIGMDRDRIRRLYAAYRLAETPGKYTRGGSDLRIRSNDASGGVLLFETDATGRVIFWRVGQAPQVDYLEGCS